MSLTGVQTNPDPDFEVRHVPRPKGPDAVKNVQGHVGHFSCVTVSVPGGNARGHHVGITDSFHLNTKNRMDDVAKKFTNQEIHILNSRQSITEK